ncbi:MAG: hypothetical protein ACKO5R_05250 [Planctomycetaceae bacterium]
MKPLTVVAALFVSLALAAPAKAVDLSGSWCGTWSSSTTGHAGPLRAEFTPCGAGRWRADFSGRFFKVFPFRYSVTLCVTEDRGDEVVLAGDSWLGRLFGTFTYRARATACSFEACYSSRKDRGAFHLERSAR